MEKTRRVETETRLEAAAAELERGLAKAQAETQTQTARVSEMTENPRAPARVADRARSSWPLNRAGARRPPPPRRESATPRARGGARRARARRSSDEYSVVRRETRLVAAARRAAVPDGEAAEMFKTQLKSAEADISAAALSHNVGSALAATPPP